MSTSFLARAVQLGSEDGNGLEYQIFFLFFIFYFLFFIFYSLIFFLVVLLYLFQLRATLLFLSWTYVLRYVAK
jgi:hypothetical protein